MRLCLFLLFSVSLAGCASNQDAAADLSARIADAYPQWAGGMPKDVPPRRGTPEYETWQAERANEAARIKTAPNPN
jgi:hypothetical protein